MLRMLSTSSMVPTPKASRSSWHFFPTQSPATHLTMSSALAEACSTALRLAAVAQAPETKVVDVLVEAAEPLDNQMSREQHQSTSIVTSLAKSSVVALHVVATTPVDYVPLANDVNAREAREGTGRVIRWFKGDPGRLRMSWMLRWQTIGTRALGRKRTLVLLRQRMR